jgi:signal transduction histidine kinase/CheY-like chemotaxis protein
VPFVLSLRGRGAGRVARRFAELHGLGARLSLRGWVSSIHPNDRARFVAWLRVARRGAIPHACDYRLADPAASFRALRVVARRGEDGALQGVLVDRSELQALEAQVVETRERVASELARRRQVEERLHRSQALLRQTSALARIGGYELDLATGRMLLTDETLSVLELPDGTDLDVTGFLGHFPTSSGRALEQAFTRCASSGRPFDLELTMLTRSGWTASVRVMGQRDQMPSGATRVWGCVRDLTERKREESDLIAARELALEAAWTKSRFLTNMSHELRTPLNGVLGMAALALESPLPEETRDCVETIRRSAVAMVELVNDILDVTQVEAGKLTLEAAPFDLAALAVDVMTSHAVAASAKDVELLVELRLPAPCPRTGDATRVRQILTNLVSNAVKFTERGHVKLVVEATSPDEVELVVADTGVGIPAARLDAIFEAFAQADGTLTRRFGGTGLGLTISRQLAELMHGALDVDSMVGVGSTFTCRLQLPPTTHEALGAAGAVIPPPPDARVLVVERSVGARGLLVDGLTALGVAVVGVGTATEALARADEARAAGRPFTGAAIDASLPSLDTLLGALASRAPGLVATWMTTPKHRAPPSSEQRSVAKPTTAAGLVTALFGAPPRREREAKGALAARVVGPSLRVLLAEDNPVNAKIAKRMLERLGHFVVHVPNGAAAVAAAEDTTLDLILMDVQMPELDGLEATRRIRSRESSCPRSALPIVALTAHAMKTAEEECYSAGMDGFLTKPLDVGRLDRVLAEIVEARKSQLPGALDAARRALGPVTRASLVP